MNVLDLYKIMTPNGDKFHYAYLQEGKFQLLKLLCGREIAMDSAIFNFNSSEVCFNFTCNCCLVNRFKIGE